MDYSVDEEGKSKDLEEPPVLSPRNKGDNSSMQSDQDMPEIAESPEQFAKMVIRISFLHCKLNFVHCAVYLCAHLIDIIFAWDKKLCYVWLVIQVHCFKLNIFFSDSSSIHKRYQRLSQNLQTNFW
jgi:hypothetical protein